MDAARRFIWGGARCLPNALRGRRMRRPVMIALAVLLSLPGMVHAAPEEIRTIAGGATGDGGPASTAALNDARGVAVDGQGNLYIADEFNHRIRKVTPNGTISTVAGNGITGFSGDGGAATSANLLLPTDVAIDPSGGLFIADFGNRRVRRVDPAGVIRTVAGGGTQTGNGIPATMATLTGPSGIAADAQGNLFIADQFAHVVRKVDPMGNISTVAGTGVEGYSGDGGPATSAKLNGPRELSLDPTGALFIADERNQRIRRVAGGIISTVAGNGTPGASGDGGAATSASLWYPVDVAVAGGDLYIAEGTRVRRVSGGIITRYAGFGTGAGIGGTDELGDGGPATEASLFIPIGVALDSTGNLYISDHLQRRVRRVDLGGTITTVVGNGGYGGDGGPADQATLSDPLGMALGPSGALYVADSRNHRIRRISSSGSISTVAGRTPDGFVGRFSGDGGPATEAQFSFPRDVAVGVDGTLYIADSLNQRVRKVAPDGIVSTIAGNGSPLSSGDGGPATSAGITFPGSVAVNATGTLYISDYNNRIRRVDTQGIITTIAGTGAAGFAGDGGPATSALLNHPGGISLDRAGNLYIADIDNHRIRKVDRFGIISTVAGSAESGFSGDGGPATSARLAAPRDVTSDPCGNLYIADFGNHRIRSVDAVTDQISTIVGSTAGFGGDGGPASQARLFHPKGVVVTGSQPREPETSTAVEASYLYISEWRNQRIRRVEATVVRAILHPGCVLGGPF